MIRAVTLDCAETLVKVRWAPGSFAIDCLEACGIQHNAAIAKPIYEALVQERWQEYIQINATRDAQQCVDWWRRLTETWLERIGIGIDAVPEIMSVSARLLYDPPGQYFELFDEVGIALDQLHDQKLSCHVLSNWDYSLHRVISAHGLTSRFGEVIASLEEGVEKPESRLFDIAACRIGLPAERILHVGDNPIDDFQGGLDAGFNSVLLDRNSDSITKRSIPMLTSIPEWIQRFGPN